MTYKESMDFTEELNNKISAYYQTLRRKLNDTPIKMSVDQRLFLRIIIVTIDLFQMELEMLSCLAEGLNNGRMDIEGEETIFLNTREKRIQYLRDRLKELTAKQSKLG